MTLLAGLIYPSAHRTQVRRVFRVDRGKGLNARIVQRMRKFHIAFPIGIKQSLNFLRAFLDPRILRFHAFGRYLPAVDEQKIRPPLSA